MPHSQRLENATAWYRSELIYYILDLLSESYTKHTNTKDNKTQTKQKAQMDQAAETKSKICLTSHRDMADHSIGQDNHHEAELNH